MPIDLTPEQQHALATALSPDRPVISITGPAGSGKSTLLAQVAQRAPTSAVLTTTNKAATVLRAKGLQRAATVHSILYTPAEVHRHKKTAAGETVYQTDAEGNVLKDSHNQPIPEITSKDVSFDLRSEGLEQLPARAYVDEASMLSEQVLSDLHSTFKSVVLIGDKFQLPPVKSKDVFALHPPAVELTTVHRTALENPILKWATELRTVGLTKPTMDEHHLKACSITHPKLYDSILANNCQAICFSNRLRHIVNARIRQTAQLPAAQLQPGEAIVALDNVRLMVEGKPTLKFYNGEILTLAEASPPGGECRFYQPVPLRFTNNKTHRVWPFWVPGFWEEYMSPRWNNTIFRMRQQGELYGAPLLADHAVCLTAHKAQGSEWPNVVVFHQKSSLDRAMSEVMHRRWLYTAATRAQERCLVVEC